MWITIVLIVFIMVLIALWIMNFQLSNAKEDINDMQFKCQFHRALANQGIIKLQEVGLTMEVPNQTFVDLYNEGC